jgi:hypothetical protein
LPLAANVESANSIRADVIGSIDLVRASDCLCPRARAFSTLFADVIRATPLYDIIMNYVRHFRKRARPVRSCLLSMHWTVANHKRGGAVSVSVAGNMWLPMDATTIELGSENPS